VKARSKSMIEAAFAGAAKAPFVATRLTRSTVRAFSLLVLPLVLLAVACRTARPAGNETTLPPIAAPSVTAAISDLQNRRTHFTGERSLMRIRATAGGSTQSFRAQLQVDAGERMQLTAYTPVGTTALTLYADGDQVVFLNALDQTSWKGSAGEFARGFGFFGSLKPSELAMLLLGLPARAGTDARMLSDTSFGIAPGMIYDVTPSGLSRASIETDDDLVVVAYDPPAQPPRTVKVEHGHEQLEVTHLEIVASDATLTPPPIPPGYRAGGVPRLP